jgi:hypothetical protein
MELILPPILLSAATNAKRLKEHLKMEQAVSLALLVRTDRPLEPVALLVKLASITPIMAQKLAKIALKDTTALYEVSMRYQQMLKFHLLLLLDLQIQKMDLSIQVC